MRHAPALAELYGVCGCGMLTIWRWSKDVQPLCLRYLIGPSGLTLALMLATRTMLPPPWGIMLRAASRAVKNAPWTLMSYNRLIRSKG